MIYLDNAATSFPKPEPVYQALDRFARTSLANPGAGRAQDGDRQPSTRSTTTATRSTSSSTAGTRALDLHPQLHRRPEHGDQGAVQPRRPRRHDGPGAQQRSAGPCGRWRRPGAITLTRVAARRRRRRPGRDPPGDHPARPARRDDARRATCSAPSSRSRRSRRIVREAGRCSWSTRPRRPGSSRSTCRRRRSTCSRSPATSRCYGPTGTGALYVGPRADGRLGLARGGHRRRLVQRDPAAPTSLLPGGRHAERARRRRPGRGDRLGRRARAGQLRRHEVELLQQVVDWAEDCRGWRSRVAGTRRPTSGHSP